MKVIIDRFEGEYAVVEIDVGKCVDVPKVLFPNAKEGDVVEIKIDYDEIKSKNGKLIYNLEIDFIINVDRSNLEIKLSNEHSEYKWVTKDSKYLDDFIKCKLSNL